MSLSQSRRRVYSCDDAYGIYRGISSVYQRIFYISIIGLMADS